MKTYKILVQILNNREGSRFAELQQLLKGLGFTLERINGSHHIFKHPAVAELVNIQEVGGKAKPYQVRQILALIEKYNLEIEEKR